MTKGMTTFEKMVLRGIALVLEGIFIVRSGEVLAENWHRRTIKWRLEAQNEETK